MMAADPVASVQVHPTLIANLLSNRCALESCCLLEQDCLTLRGCVPAEFCHSVQQSVCEEREGFRRCEQCRTVRYCSAEHQIAHQPLHESVCSSIRTRWLTLEQLKADLRSAPPGADIPEDVFNSAVGHFWKHAGTHSYMKAMFDFQNALLLVNTKDAVQLALHWCMYLLRLDRSDNLSVMDIVPPLLLRLGREQECYNFIKWSVTLRKRYKRQGGHDWDDTSLPYLDIKNADAFETVAELDLHRISLSHAVALTLLKIRMRLDIAEYTATCDTLNDGLHGRQVGDLVARTLRSEADLVGASKLEKRLVRQLKTLYQAVHKIHPYYWEHFFTDGTLQGEENGFFSPGSPDEAKLVREQNARAWEETEDARLYAEVYVPQHISTRPRFNPDGPEVVVAMSWGSSGGFDGCHESLASAISAKAEFQNYTSLEAGRGLLGNFTRDTPILITNDGPLDNPDILENIVERIIGGQIVILCGQFSKNVSNTQFRTLMKRLNLRWQRGGGEDTEVGRLEAAIGLPAGFPNTYKPEAICLKHVPTANIWYVGDTPRDAAVVLKQVGRGRLGYIGDTSGDAMSDQIVMSMCGFKVDTTPPDE